MRPEISGKNYNTWRVKPRDKVKTEKNRRRLYYSNGKDTRTTEQSSVQDRFARFHALSGTF